MASVARRLRGGSAHLFHHCFHGRGGTRGLLLPPGFQTLADLFEVGEDIGVLERRPPSGRERPDAVPDRPDLTGVLEEEFVINQPPVDDTGYHVPVANGHANVRVFLRPWRVFLCHLLG